jgi:gas vesicle protein
MAKRREKSRQELEDEERVDEAIAESFPASDPPSFNAGRPRRNAGFMRPDELKWSASGDKSEGGGIKMIEQERVINPGRESKSLMFFVGSFALGAIAGLLFAPKRGSELRGELAEWGREKKVSGRQMYARAKEYLPHRRRTTPEAVREAREAGEEAIREVSELEDRES